MAGAWATFAAAGLAALSQSAQPQPKESGWERVPVQLESLSPPQRLGVRAELLRQNVPVIPVVVIVDDWSSYLEAIGAWRPSGRFPVLFDAGTAESRLDIARFVRSFEPERVVRWKAGGEEGWPRDREARQARIESAVRAAWDLDEVPDAPELNVLWAASPACAPGIIVADGQDPSWPAAAALSAGRAQSIVWVQTKGNPNGAFEADEAELLASAIELGAQGTGLEWRGLGDRLDAVTLCLNCPVKIKDAKDEFLATTDRIGRLAGGQRWAWASQIFGTQEDAAYQAMCALFLMPRRTLAFDGYPDEPQWRPYAMEQAVDVFREFGLEVRSPSRIGGRGLADWRILGATALGCDLVLVNTKGMRNWFDLSPGRAGSGDVPILDRPAMVSFIHSFSAIQPGLPATIAGRWFQRGAYAYIGAVHEPFLQAFVPPAIFAERLTRAYAWGPAARLDDGPVWKVAVFGDPLITLGPPAPRAKVEALSLVETEDVSGRAEAMLTHGKLPDALWELLLLGRTERVRDLAAAVLKDESAPVDQAILDAALVAAFDQRDAALLAAAYRRLDDASAAEDWRRDLLWHGLRLGVGAAPAAEAERMLTMLKRNLRPEQLGTDAVEIAEMMARTRLGDPVAYLRTVPITRPIDKRAVDEAMRRLGGR